MSNFKNQRRIALAQHQYQTGIDYIEVETIDINQWDLHLYFIPAAEVKEEQSGSTTSGTTKIIIPPHLTPANVQITGGKGKKKSNLKVSHVSYPEGEPSKIIITVSKDAEGDFPFYNLILSKVQNLDPFFSQIGFILDLDKPSQYDLQAPIKEAKKAIDNPQIDYLSRDYQSFRSLMLDRLSEVSPQWQERNPADLMVTMVETLAYSADQLSYYQDAVATEAYLGTARLRKSVRRHAKLIDYAMHEGCNARTLVHLELKFDEMIEDGSNLESRSLFLERGTRFFTKVIGKATILARNATILNEMLSQGTQVFESMHVANLYPKHNLIPIYDWGLDEFVLSEGSSEATLEGHYPNLKKGDVLIFEETRSPTTGMESEAEPKHRHAVRLTSVTPSKDALAIASIEGGGSGSLITQITWNEEDALPFTLHVVVLINGSRISGITVGRANTILLDHGYTVINEDLEPSTVREGRKYQPRLRMSNLTQANRYDDSRAREQSLFKTLNQDPRSAIPLIRVESNDELWTARGDLINSDRSASEFVVEMENDRSATLRFGDGTHGRSPIAGSRFTANYRVGNGVLGNIGSDSIAHIAYDGVGIRSVRNPLSGHGGIEPESLDQVRFYAPQAFERQERAVTADDYALCAEKHPDVERASAYIGMTGSWSTVRLTIQRKNRKLVDEAFKKRLITFLEDYRLIGFEVAIVPSRFLPLDIALVVYPTEGTFPSAINSKLLEKFSNREPADGSPGFFHPSHFSFGTPIYLSNMVTEMMNVSGVDWIDLKDPDTKFQRWGEPKAGAWDEKNDNSELSKGLIKPLPLEIVKLDNEPDHPENGVLKFIIKEAL